MKRVTKRGVVLMSIIALVSVMALVAIGQAPDRGERGARGPGGQGMREGRAAAGAITPDDFVKRVKDRLDVTEEQAEQIKKIYTEAQVTIDEINTELREVTKKRNEAIGEVLGEEKARQAFSLLRSRTQGESGGRDRTQMSGRGGSAGMMMLRGRMAEELELTEEQKTKIKEIGQTTMEAMKSAQEKSSEDTKALLSPEQLKKYEEMTARFQHGGERTGKGERGQKSGEKSDKGQRGQKGKKGQEK